MPHVGEVTLKFGNTHLQCRSIQIDTKELSFDSTEELGVGMFCIQNPSCFVNFRCMDKFDV